MSRTEIQNMTTVERLAAMEALWDALCHEGQEPTSPQWHEKVLQERRQKLQTGAARFLSLDEVERRLRR